jgi:hypothetical protein
LWRCITRNPVDLRYRRTPRRCPHSYSVDQPESRRPRSSVTTCRDLRARFGGCRISRW